MLDVLAEMNGLFYNAVPGMVIDEVVYLDFVGGSTIAGSAAFGRRSSVKHISLALFQSVSDMGILLLTHP